MRGLWGPKEERELVPGTHLPAPTRVIDQDRQRGASGAVVQGWEIVRVAVCFVYVEVYCA